ncbi:MAG: MBL fold metallo-hydrolase, partial [Planctomycetaceae bacterium]
MSSNRPSERSLVRKPPSKGPLLAVAPDVFCLQLSIVNVYLLGHVGCGDRGWVLIDAGLFGSAGAIRRAAQDLFGRDARPSAIVLTHGHFDHVGAARSLADTWDVPIFAHRLEMPYLTGRSAYP